MIAIGADHGGYFLKEEIKKHLEERGIEYKDFGTYTPDSIDYAKIAYDTCQSVVSGECERAILCCGTGIGISMAANKDANALCLGGRVVGAGLAIEMVDVFLDTEFEGGRHQRRVDQIMAIENGTF